MQHFWHSNGQGCPVLQRVAALYNSSSNEYSRIHLPEDTFLLLEDEAAVPDCQSGCFVSRGGRPSCLSSTPRSSTFDVLSHRSERLSHFQAVLWAQTGMQKPRVYLKREAETASSPVTGQCCISANAISFLQLTARAERRYWRGLLASEWIIQSHHQKRHKPNMKCYWRRKLNTTSWPLPLRSWKRMILHTKQKCTRFSTLATKWCYKRGSEGSPDELHIHREGNFPCSDHNKHIFWTKHKQRANTCISDIEGKAKWNRKPELF